MAKASDNVFPRVIYGMNTADQAAPADSSWRVYAKTNGIFARSSNAIVGPFGTGGGGSGVATDSIWTTSGKVAVATGTATATEQWPPGHEFDYVGSSGTNAITATSEATATTIITANAVAYDGSTIVMIEFFVPEAIPPSTDNNFVRFVLYDGSSSIGYFGIVFDPKLASGSSARWPVHLMRRLTPSAASHTYSVRGYVSSGTGEANGGAGGTATYLPVFIRQTKV